MQFWNTQKRLQRNGSKIQVRLYFIEVYPPYHEFIDNSLNLSDLRKLKFKGKNESKNQNDKKHDKMTRI